MEPTSKSMKKSPTLLIKAFDDLCANEPRSVGFISLGMLIGYFTQNLSKEEYEAAWLILRAYADDGINYVYEQRRKRAGI